MTDNQRQMWTKTGWSIWVAIAGFYAPAGWVQLPALAEPTLIAQRSNSAADASYQRGLKLFQQGTAESLRAAIPYYQEAVRLYEQAGDRTKQALAQLGLGRVYSDLGEKRRALEYYHQALLLVRAVGDRTGEAVILENIAGAYDVLGEKRQARDYYEQALPLFRAIGDRSREATILNNIGLIDSEFGENQQALDYYEQALSLSRSLGDRLGEATILNNIGVVYSALGEQSRALDYYKQALPLRQTVGDRAGEAATLFNIGKVYDDLGEKRQARDYYEQALPLFRAIGDRATEARILNSIGLIDSEFGENQQALDYYEQALPLSRAVGDGAVEARILNNMGGVYSALGENQQAREYYEQALPLFRALGDRAGEAASLQNIGGIYSQLGENRRAREYFEQALPLFRGVGDRSMEARTLISIGWVDFNLGENRRALDYYEQALPLFRATGDRIGEAATLNNIGGLYQTVWDNRRALDYYEQALPLSRAIGDRATEAATLNNIGGIYFDLGEKRPAREYFQQALLLRRAMGDRAGEATTLYNIARLQASQGQLTEALANTEQVINLIEELRSLAPPGELRQTFFSTVQDEYQFYIRLLMQLHQQNPQKGYDALAFHASERSRARTLLELLREANADIRQGVAPELVAAERRLQQEIDRVETRRLEIFGDDNSSEKQKENIKAELAQLWQQYEEIRARISAASPRYAALTQPQPLTLAQVQQQVLDEETVLLQYSLGEATSYLWVVTSTEMTSYKLPGREKIAEKANQFRGTITRPSRRHNQGWVNVAAQELSEMILQPAADHLQKKRLLISADGILQNIPFSALTISPGEVYEPLIKQYEIVRSPSASAIAQIRQDTASRTPATKTLAVFADPVFTPDDERVKTPVAATPPDELLLAAIPEPRGETWDAVDGWDRLEYTRTEAETILGLVPETESTAAFDFDANLEAILNSEELQNYQIIHFATHGLANGRNPALSGLVFSLIDEGGNWQNGYLRLNDIFNLNLPAELVVLSACQTALGRDLKGEGMVGITRGFMYAGAPRLVASLWFVDDEGTSVLMSKFYQKILSENLSPVEAMRSAQLEMLASSEYNSPYYWAGFTFQGEWNDSAVRGE